MPKNLEIKIKVNQLENYIEKIIKLKGKKIYSSLQIDVYYQVPKGRMKVRNSNGEKSVIFYNRVEDGKERWSDFYVVKVKEPKLWVNFFDKVFDRLIMVKKNRTLFHYKNTRIHFDRVSGLGNFIELETKVNSSKKEARKEFDFLCKELNLDKSNQIFNSYSDLLIATLKK